MPVTSRLTSKAQTTIPGEVREKLQLRPGETILYDVEDDVVRLRKEMPLDREYRRALQETLTEWNSPEDAAAYDDL